jgi:hypothetical protein
MPALRLRDCRAMVEPARGDSGTGTRARSFAGRAPLRRGELVAPVSGVAHLILASDPPFFLEFLLQNY